MQAKKHYTDEFKKEAIHLLEMSGKTVTEIERGLGISHGLLRKWQKFRQIYGAPRIWAELLKMSVEVSLNRVAKSMREAGLQGKTAGKTRP